MEEVFIRKRKQKLQRCLCRYNTAVSVYIYHRVHTLAASWGVAQSTELWLLTTRAGVRILTELTNAMHKFIELYALNQITLGVWCTPS